MPYKFDKDDLLKLLMRAYDEGNCGFLDLSESVAEKLIAENADKYFETVLACQTPSVYTYNPDVFPGSVIINNEWTEGVNIGNISLNNNNLTVSNSNQMEVNV